MDKMKPKRVCTIDQVMAIIWRKYLDAIIESSNSANETLPTTEYRAANRTIVLVFHIMALINDSLTFVLHSFE